MARSSASRACSHDSRSMSSSAVGDSSSCRLARRAMAVTLSRSRTSSSTGEGAGWGCRCAFKNNCGCSSIRCRILGDAPRQASYNCRAWRLLKWCCAKAAAIFRQSSRLARATGTKYFMAICAEICPWRTCCCTLSGRSSTKAKRLATQLTLRSNCRANSSTL